MLQLTPERRDALAEILNIGYGRSMSALAEMLNVYIRLNVPDLKIIGGEDVTAFLADSFAGDDEVTLVQQVFQGDFFGEAVLALSAESSAELVDLLGSQQRFTPLADDKLAMEVLLEMGNMVVGACLGQMAELLGTDLTFNPPVVFWDRVNAERIRERVVTRNGDALLINTRFELEERVAFGYILIFMSHQCFEWLFAEVDRFLAELA